MIGAYFRIFNNSGSSKVSFHVGYLLTQVSEVLSASVTRTRFVPWWWALQTFLKHGSISSRLHGAISQKAVIFILTIVRTRMWLRRLFVDILLLLQWRDSPRRALLSSIVRLQISLSPAHLLHPLTFSSSNESLLMLSSHISCGLPTGLLPCNFPSSTFFGILGLLALYK
jgi:hypothetical protein